MESVASEMKSTLSEINELAIARLSYEPGAGGSCL
jgi:hypothetical protein